MKAALEHFQPKQGERLDHGAYERSKQEIATALANDGFIRAQLVKHRVEVVRAANSAEIDLEWDAGARHRLGAAALLGRAVSRHFPAALHAVARGRVLFDGQSC